MLSTPFYPLGREPRLFDAFYLGAKEAFSKPYARIEVCFKTGQSPGSAYMAITFPNSGAQCRIIIPGSQLSAAR